MKRHKCKLVTVLVKDKNFSKFRGELKRLEKLYIKAHWHDAEHFVSGDDV